MPTLTTKKAIKRAKSKSKRRRTWSLKRTRKRAYKTKGQRGFINKLDNFEAEKIPPKISKEAFLESGFDEIVNKENLLAHFEKKQDKSGRLEFLNLVEPTRIRPNAILKTKDKNTDELRKAFLKVFDGEKNKKFYVLFTQIDDEKIAITGIPMSEKSKIKKLIREALEVLDDKK